MPFGIERPERRFVCVRVEAFMSTLVWVLLSIPAGTIMILLWCAFLNKVLYAPRKRREGRVQVPAE
jgi:putative effector of murein hydrolase LrgA (UPF0299 family)